MFLIIIISVIKIMFPFHLLVFLFHWNLYWCAYKLVLCSKLYSLVVSFFTSVYITKWQDFFPEKNLRYPPSFRARVVCCASIEVLQAYLAWRQQFCKCSPFGLKIHNVPRFCRTYNEVVHFVWYANTFFCWVGRQKVLIGIFQIHIFQVISVTWTIRASGSWLNVGRQTGKPTIFWRYGIVVFCIFWTC